MDLCEVFRQEIGKVEAERIRGEELKNGYVSIDCYHQKEQLEKVLARLEAGEEPEALIRELEPEAVRLRELEEKEEIHPTFDWAGDHYWACVYSGARSGCERAIRLLKGQKTW